MNLIDLLKYLPAVVIGVLVLFAVFGNTIQYMIACLIYGILLGVYRELGKG